MTRFEKMTAMTALTGVLLAFQATVSTAVQISDITIRSEAAVIADDAATNHWPNLESDLKNALIAELADVSSDAGVVMQVTVRELSVATAADATGDDGTLETTVMFISGGQAAGTLHHAVAVNQKGEDGVTADRIILPRTSEEFYAALVDHYAKTVAEKIRAYN